MNNALVQHVMYALISWVIYQVFYGGVVFSWGVAFSGELGHTEYTTKGICPVPRQVLGLHSIIQVGCGEG